MEFRNRWEFALDVGFVEMASIQEVSRVKWAGWSEWGEVSNVKRTGWIDCEEFTNEAHWTTSNSRADNWNTSIAICVSDCYESNQKSLATRLHSRWDKFRWFLLEMLEPSVCSNWHIHNSSRRTRTAKENTGIDRKLIVMFAFADKASHHQAKAQSNLYWK